jgi:NitT/TauT family transport system ATP-binding protein
MTDARAGSDGPLLVVEGLRHVYGSGASSHEAIADLSFGVEDREFLSIVGPSGCGKTTLLKCTSGLLPPTEGRVTLAGEDISGVPEILALVFQDYSRSLFPWLTVRGNVRLPLTRQRLGKAEEQDRVMASLEAVGLAAAAERYPWQLSGGMQQRVALCRALIHEPALLLMDEPFGALDELTRMEMNDLLLQIRVKTRATVVFVTHSIAEAVYLSDQVLVFSRRPARIAERIAVDLAYPRSAQTRFTPRFAELSKVASRALGVLH